MADRQRESSARSACGYLHVDCYERASGRRSAICVGQQWSGASQQPSLARPTLIKPNFEELLELTG